MPLSKPQLIASAAAPDPYSQTVGAASAGLGSLTTAAEANTSQYDAFYQLTCHASDVDDQFALIDPATGQIRAPQQDSQVWRQVGKPLESWTGRIYQKLRRLLLSLADHLFTYQPFLIQTLRTVLDQWGQPAIATLVRLWQQQADAKRRPLSLLERQAA